MSSLSRCSLLRHVLDDPARILGSFYSPYFCTVQVSTGKIPLSDLPDFKAGLAIIGGMRPSRPLHPAVTGELWELMQRCWNSDPYLRPEATEVLRVLAPDYTSPENSPQSSYTTAESSPPSAYTTPEASPRLCAALAGAELEHSEPI